MRFTDRQTLLLARIDRLTTRTTKRGVRRYFLVHEDFTATVNLLIVRGVLVRNSLEDKPVIADRIRRSADQLVQLGELAT